MKKLYYWIIGILLLLIITNPTYKDLKEHLSLSNEANVKRVNNFFICSTYRNNGVTYFGIIGNFFRINTTTNTTIDINELRKEVLKEQADSAILYSDTSDTNHNKISATAFAERIKSRFPEYKDLDNKVLIRKLVIKFPEYKDIVDTTQ